MHGWIAQANSDDGSGVVCRPEPHGTQSASPRKNATKFPVLNERSVQDAEYVKHSANAYPHLIFDAQESLKMLAGLSCPFGEPFAPLPQAKQCQCNYHEWYRGRIATLHSLGEAE